VKKLIFKQLARELDIQTLTIVQIKSLSTYYQDNNQANPISELLRLKTKREEKLQEIIQQLRNSQEYPIEFDAQVDQEKGNK
jgi:hypothetical protein